jgi:LPS-assembly lipoprotein
MWWFKLLRPSVLTTCGDEPGSPHGRDCRSGLPRPRVALTPLVALNAFSPERVEGRSYKVRRARTASLMAITLLLTACGFQLRGAATYPFTSVFVQRPTAFGVGTVNVTGAAAPVVPDVISGLTSNGIQIKSKVEDADFAIRFLQVFFDKRVLSLSGGGRAREFELEYRVRYEFIDAKGRDWGEPGEITIRRDFSFAESQALAKEGEERQLVRDMQLDAAAQILRRLQAVKKPN